MSSNRFKVPVALALLIAFFGILAAYGSQPTQTVVNEGDGFVSQPSTPPTPPVSERDSAAAAPTVPSDLELAAKALNDRRWEQAIHYAMRGMRDRTTLNEAFDLLSKAYIQLADSAIALYDGNRGTAIRGSYDRARNHLNQAAGIGRQILDDDQSLRYDLSPSEVESVMVNLETIARAGRRHDEKRYAAFKGFADRTLQKVESHFAAGKGQHWWINDDEEEFMTALEHLNRVHAVVEELREADRESVFGWDRILKSELTDAQYKSAIARSQFIDGIR